MDNARVHLHSEDFNPREKHHKKGDLQKMATGRTDDKDAKERLREAIRSDHVEFLRACHGARVPEMFKVAQRHGGVVERTPPVPPGAPAYRIYMGGNEGELFE